MGRLMEIFRQLEQSDSGQEVAVTTRGAAVAQCPTNPRDGDGRIADVMCGLKRLEARCPARVDIQDWQQAVRDARDFVSGWGVQAVFLGWTRDDLFRLATARDKILPVPSAAVGQNGNGLVWALRGRQVVALTGNTATFRSCDGRPLFLWRNRQA